MSFIGIVTLALALSMDAAAVSASRGLATSQIRLSHVLKVALLFGGFQALMPVLGWWVGDRIGAQVEAWDHWIAFVLLGGLGVKMIWEAREVKTPPEGRDEALYAMPVMFGLGVATSLDALAAGVTLKLLDAPMTLSAVTIGVTTAALCAASLFAGRRFGKRLGQRMDIVGGVVLVALGTKVLIEHWLA